MDVLIKFQPIRPYRHFLISLSRRAAIRYCHRFIDAARPVNDNLVKPVNYITLAWKAAQKRQDGTGSLLLSSQFSSVHLATRRNIVNATRVPVIAIVSDNVGAMVDESGRAICSNSKTTGSELDRAESSIVDPPTGGFLADWSVNENERFPWWFAKCRKKNEKGKYWLMKMRNFEKSELVNEDLKRGHRERVASL